MLRVKGDLKQRETLYLDAIMEAADDASSLSQSMLAYSRNQVMKQAVSDLNVLLVKVGKFTERLLPENVELILTPANDPLLVNIDSGQIEQIMINITTNARDAMPGGGTLSITAGVENIDPATLSDKETSNIHHRYAVITAGDTGHGMDEETKSRIFDPFFTTKEIGKGSGLGLSMVFGIVKQHGGEITVQSSPGNGTILKIWLPLVDADAPEVINLSKPVDIIINDPGKRTGRILMAEDNQIFRLVLEEFFTEAGYDVILAEDGNKAVEMFKADRDGIDLVITDVLMPNKSGREARDEIKKLSETAKFIFMSGHTRDVLSHQGDLGDAELFMKPIDLPLLLSKVRELI